MEGKLKRGKTCDDNELREDEEDVCKEADSRQIGQVRQEEGEDWDGDDEERAEVNSCLPLIHSFLLLEDVLEGQVPPVAICNGLKLVCLFITALADQPGSHSHHKHW